MHVYKHLGIFCILTASSLVLRAEPDFSTQQFVQPDLLETANSGNLQSAELSGHSRSDVPLTYEIALQRALASDPRLPLGEAWSQAASGRVLQADTMPNPVLGVQAENFLGSGPQRGTRGLEITAGISQLIETGGKQEKRTALARMEREQLRWDQELLLNQIQSDLRNAFITALLAQKQVALKQQQLELLEQIVQETERLAQAARSSQAELARARLAVRQQQFALQRAERERVAARQQLALRWGEVAPVEFELDGDIVLRDKLPSLSELALTLSNSAALRRYEAVSRTRQAAVENEKARAMPDVEVFAGARYFNEDEGSYGLMLGVQVPLPLFDRNRGNILAAQAERRAAEYEQQAARRQLMSDLSIAYRELQTAHEEALALKQDLLPAAEQVLKEMQDGYAKGRFTLLEVLSSREALFEVEEAYLDTLSRYASAEVRIEALTRPSLPEQNKEARSRIGAF